MMIVFEAKTEKSETLHGSSTNSYTSKNVA